MHGWLAGLSASRWSSSRFPTPDARRQRKQCRLCRCAEGKTHDIAAGWRIAGGSLNWFDHHSIQRFAYENLMKIGLMIERRAQRAKQHQQCHASIVVPSRNARWIQLVNPRMGCRACVIQKQIEDASPIFWFDYGDAKNMVAKDIITWRLRRRPNT